MSRQQNYRFLRPGKHILISSQSYTILYNFRISVEFHGIHSNSDQVTRSLKTLQCYLTDMGSLTLNLQDKYGNPIGAASVPGIKRLAKVSSDRLRCPPIKNNFFNP